MRRIAWLLLSAPLLMMPAIAGAQAPSAQASAAARSLASEGDTLWDQGKYDQALDRFTRAFGLVNAPTLAIRQAECLVKLGRLVEASEVYVKVSRMNLATGASDAFRAAVTSAMAQAATLRERLPMLLVQVQGEQVDGARLLVDGREIPAELIGADFPVDPGDRQITVEKGERRETQSIHIEEREHKAVTILLPPPTGEPKDEKAPVAAGPAAGPSPPAEQPPARPAVQPPPRAVDQGVQTSGSSSQRTWGWVGLAVGAAGIAGGTVTGVMAISKRNTLDKTCVSRACPSSEQSNVDSYNQLRLLSTIGFGVGIAGAGTGLVLLLTAKDPQQPAAGVRPWVGVGTIGAEGTF